MNNAILHPARQEKMPLERPVAGNCAIFMLPRGRVGWLATHREKLPGVFASGVCTKIRPPHVRFKSQESHGPSQF